MTLTDSHSYTDGPRAIIRRFHRVSNVPLVQLQRSVPGQPCDTIGRGDILYLGDTLYAKKRGTQRVAGADADTRGRMGLEVSLLIQP